MTWTEWLTSLATLWTFVTTKDNSNLNFDPIGISSTSTDPANHISPIPTPYLLVDNNNLTPNHESSEITTNTTQQHSFTTNLQKNILNVTNSWNDKCNCSINSSLYNNGFNDSSINNGSINNNNNISNSDQQINSNSIITQYLVNLSEAINFGNQTYKSKKTNFNDTIDNVTNLIFYYNNVNNNNNETFNNFNNSTEYDQQTILFINFYQSIVTAFILGLIILTTVIGNVFVIAAILLERNLQSVANYLILSLAVADLLVACCVMPLAAIYQISEQWTLGAEICDLWNQVDVLCCTASILNLVAIALDRYWAVTDIDYHQKRTTKRIGLMILTLWILSFLVSIAPILGWRDKNWEQRIKNLQCIVSQDIGYQIFATGSSFYIPLLVILFLYWKIFLTARKRIRKKQNPPNTAKMMKPVCNAVTAVVGRPLPTISETTTAFTNLSSNTSPEKESNARKEVEADMPTCDVSTVGGLQGDSPIRHTKRRRCHPGSTDSKRERKAAKTLGIITGAFLFCWTPFFVLAIVLPIYQYNNSITIPRVFTSVSLWLGYFNSTLNPIIYTIFSPEFRSAFKKLIFGRKTQHRNPRHQLGLKHR